jgi:hypothetical protein
VSAGIDFEAIAQRIHRFYCQLALKEGWPNDFPVPYPALPEYMKADNRAAARRIGQVLALAGLRLGPRAGSAWPRREQEQIRQLIEQNIDLLAEGEHEGWVESRLREGWRVGGGKDVARREHHLLVPYSEFPRQVERRQMRERARGDPPRLSVDEEVKKERDKDRESVRNYVPIIRQTDFCIVREAGDAGPGETNFFEGANDVTRRRAARARRSRARSDRASHS